MQFRKLFAPFVIVVLMLSILPMQFSASAAPSTTLVINEIDYDQPGTDTAEFIELKNVGTTSANLSEYSLELVNGTGGGASVYSTITFGTQSLAAGDYFVICANSATVNNCDVDVTPDTNLIQNGSPDAVGLRHNGDLIDAVSYEGNTGAPYTEGSGTGLEDNPDVENAGISRFPDGVDTDQNNEDFSLRCSTPGEANAAESSNCSSGPTPPPPDFVSIHDIQYTTDASGDSPYVGQTVTTEGIVTGFFYNGGNKYTFIQDGTGPWSGLVLYKPDVFINVGDKLQVHGQVSEYSGLTEISYGAATVLSSGNSLPTAETLSSGDVSQEMWEAVLVRVENVRVTNPDLGFGEWQVDDGSGGVVVDDLGYYSYIPVLNAFLPFVQGPLYYSYGAFKIEPRDDSDIGEILPIGTVQGSVSDTADGATFASPYNGESVVIQGVIYQLLEQKSGSSTYYALHIQNTAATADGDPDSSDGIYVFMSRYPDILALDGGPSYLPQVGDEIILRGWVSEYYNLTELSGTRWIETVRTGVDLDSELPAFDVNPPSDLADANRYWERREGMRGQVPTDSIVLNGRNVFASSADAEVWVARPDSVIAQRTDPYTRRAFRDAHPLDDNYDPNNWDGNGYRILMGSLGIKAAENDNTAMIAPARTFDTVTNTPVGGVYYSYSKYSIQPDQQVDFSDGVDPAANNPPTTFDRTQDYSIVDYNLENLYDYRNDPFSGCDFTGDSGCSNSGTPFLGSITPPFDYVPASDAAYQARLNDIALQIINDLHNPDILMVQEVENQDICTITNGAMDCGTTDNADGQPDDLQDLALKIASLGGPTYAAAFDRDSSDLRGIVPAFMYRTDRVQLLSPDGDPLLGGLPAINYAGQAASFNGDVSNPKTLNATSLADTTGCETTMVFPRAPDIGLFRIWRDGIGASVFTDVYVVDNHFKSGPDSCVAPRTEQAKYNAAIVEFLQDAKPNANIVVGGDLNVYPRPDDPFAPIGQPGSSDQLGSLYNPGLGLTNLWEVLLGQVPEAAYSYVYQGQAQTLDQMFVNQSMLADLGQIRSAHINSDFPADYPDDVARGTSDHDPQFAVYSNLPTIDRLEELVKYYDANGKITGNNTTRILLDRLEKARRFEENGKHDAYVSQLQAFIDQIYDFTPQFITQDASNSLTNETTLLLSLP